jgi:hypothetical protein
MKWSRPATDLGRPSDIASPNDAASLMDTESNLTLRIARTRRRKFQIRRDPSNFFYGTIAQLSRQWRRQESVRILWSER